MLTLFKTLPYIFLLSGAGYAYHTYKVERLEFIIQEKEALVKSLREDIANLVKTNEANLENIRTLDQTVKDQQSAYSTLSDRFDSVVAERDEYLSIFRRHNLTKLSRAKPGLIEPRINNGTEEVFRQIESDSREVHNADF